VDIEALFSTLPAGVAVTDPDIVASYARDQSTFTDSSPPLAMLAPTSTDEVSQCLAWAHQHRIPVVPRGAGTGLSGGANAAPGSVVLSLHRMTSLLEIDPVERLAVVQPGMIVGDLRAEVARLGLHYPPDPGSVEMSSIGGNVATNAGGMCCVKYGTTGDFVESLQIVLADGRVMRTGSRTVKGVAGYELTSLFVGSEGTLGVITEITVRLLPAPRSPHTLVASFSSLADAGEAVAGLRREGVSLSMLEILDRTTISAVNDMLRMGLDDVDALLLMQSDARTPAADLDAAEEVCGAAIDLVRSEDPAESELLLAARRQALPALERLGDWLLDDVCVPIARITELIATVAGIADRSGLRIGVFGHAGDGNLHPTVIFDRSDPASHAAAVQAFDEITGAALRLGGTITGEHGVGLLKQDWLRRELDPVNIQVQRAVKLALDPHGILNPGKAIGS
jgi:glycolate oxidase